MSTGIVASLMAGGCGGLVVLAGQTVASRIRQIAPSRGARGHGQLRSGDPATIHISAPSTTPDSEPVDTPQPLHPRTTQEAHDAQAAHARLRQQQVSDYADRLAADNPELRERLRVFEGRVP